MEPGEEVLSNAEGGGGGPQPGGEGFELAEHFFSSFAIPQSEHMGGEVSRIGLELVQLGDKRLFCGQVRQAKIFYTYQTLSDAPIQKGHAISDHHRDAHKCCFQACSTRSHQCDVGGSDDFAQMFIAQVEGGIQLKEVGEEYFLWEVRGAWDDNFQPRDVLGDEVSGFDEDGEHSFNFHMSATGDEGQHRCFQGEAECFFEVRLRFWGGHLLDDGVSDEIGIDAASPIEFRLKRQNAQEGVGNFCQCFHSTFAPSPDAWADVPDDGDVHFFKAFSEAGIEVRKVHQESDGGFSDMGFRGKGIEGPEDFGEFGNNGADAHDGDFILSNQQFHTLGLHLLAAHSKKASLGAKCSKVGDGAGSVRVSGNFSGNNEDIHVARLMLGNK